MADGWNELFLAICHLPFAIERDTPNRPSPGLRGRLVEAVGRGVSDSIAAASRH
jgi:hypothetical protein